MQQILPIFPKDIKVVNYQVGFKQMDDFVHYFVNGMPVYCHQVDDKNGYRYVLATFVFNCCKPFCTAWFNKKYNTSMGKVANFVGYDIGLFHSSGMQGIGHTQKLACAGNGVIGSPGRVRLL